MTWHLDKRHSTCIIWLDNLTKDTALLLHDLTALQETLQPSPPVSQNQNVNHYILDWNASKINEKSLLKN